jgi:hypothetical protein
VCSLGGLRLQSPNAPRSSGKHAVSTTSIDAGLEPLDKERGTIGRKAADYMRRIKAFTRRAMTLSLQPAP